MTGAELFPNVTVLAEMLVQLEDPPHVRLLILLVLGVDGVEFSRRTRR